MPASHQVSDKGVFPRFSSRRLLEKSALDGLSMQALSDARIRSTLEDPQNKLFHRAPALALIRPSLRRRKPMRIVPATKSNADGLQ